MAEPSAPPKENTLQRWSRVAGILMGLSSCCVVSSRALRGCESDKTPGSTVGEPAAFTGPGGVSCTTLATDVPLLGHAHVNEEAETAEAADFVAEIDDGAALVSYWVRGGRFARAQISWRATRMFTRTGGSSWPTEVVLTALESRLGSGVHDNVTIGEMAITRVTWTDGTMMISFNGSEWDWTQSGARTGAALAVFECPNWLEPAARP